MLASCVPGSPHDDDDATVKFQSPKVLPPLLAWLSETKATALWKPLSPGTSLLSHTSTVDWFCPTLELVGPVAQTGIQQRRAATSIPWYPREDLRDEAEPFCVSPGTRDGGGGSKAAPNLVQCLANGRSLTITGY